MDAMDNLMHALLCSNERGCYGHPIFTLSARIQLLLSVVAVALSIAAIIYA